jgi:DNA-binding transcriptional ArsR family regulator
MPRGPRARRGDVRAAVLALLAEAPHNGYQLMQEIERRSGGAWRPSPGSIYPALSQLEDEGLVRSEPEGTGRLFHLTEEGRAAPQGEDSTPWETVSEGVDSDAWELMRAMKQVGLAAWQVAHAGAPEQRVAAQRILTDARRALYGLLADGGEPPREP